MSSRQPKYYAPTANNNNNNIVTLFSLDNLLTI